MNSVYDLTTKSDLSLALTILPSVVKSLFNSIFKSDTEKQLEAAKGLILEGKKNGLKKLTITAEGDKGFGAQIKAYGKGNGIDISARCGRSDKWIITAEY